MLTFKCAAYRYTNLSSARQSQHNRSQSKRGSSSVRTNTWRTSVNWPNCRPRLPLKRASTPNVFQLYSPDVAVFFSDAVSKLPAPEDCQAPRPPPRIRPHQTYRSDTTDCYGRTLSDESMLYFVAVFYIFFMAALVGQTAERIFTKLSHVVDIRCYLRTY